ncbi:MAG: hypothetical protein HOC79_05740 [Euryarchaeota archaeon]|jgi:hypothetical protein|nr:hypothetical protein [Euryarchaeota archaeon]
MNEINRTNLIGLNEDERKIAIEEAFGEPVYDLLAQQEGDINRATAVVNYPPDDTGLARAVLWGDCECDGLCRQGWGWVWKAIDLNMTGHRGSLKAEPCVGAKKELNTETGELLTLAPFGMEADQFYRFQRAEWGDVSRADAIELSQFNLATAEGKKNQWSDKQ